MSATTEAAEEVAFTTARRGISLTEYSLIGSLDAVLSGIAGIFSTYSAIAYGTRVHSIELGLDGHYVARMSRSNSCD